MALSCDGDAIPQKGHAVEVKQETTTSDQKAARQTPSSSAKQSARSVPEKSPADIESYCGTICSKSKTRDCSIEPARCNAMCREMTLEPECRGEMGQVLECLAGLADAQWQCGDEGFPEVLPGHCEAEQKAVVLCLSAGLK